MFQEITVIGNAGQDPRANVTTTGKDVANFTIAVNEKHGENEKTTWFKVAAWNGLAKVVAEHVKKGRQLFVQGRVSLETWTDESGQLRADMVITADTIKFLGAKPG